MMKKILKTLALVLILAVTMSVVAFATEAEVDADGKKATLTFLDGFDGTAVFEETTGDYVNITVQSTSFKKEDGYYLVLALKDKETIDKDSILYIDQIAAADGEVSFKVYPSTMATSTIVITGVKADGTSNGKVYVAIINGKYILGDVDKSGEVDVGDATMLLRYLAKLAKADDISMDAADVDGSSEVDVGDATKLLRVLAKLDKLS